MPINYENCLGNLSIRVEVDIPKSNLNNRVSMSGNIFVSAEVTESLSFVVQSHKCSLDMAKCEALPILNIPEMCQKFKQKNAFYSEALKTIQPPLYCPIKPGVYRIENTSLDLSIISMLRLDGSIHVPTFKLVMQPKGSKVKKTVLCWMAELKIIKVRINE